ncbi:MAG: hypothetical protein N2558_03240 [Patescibacteria group bacterium]|nr:hypothetical protein [Patescibacteria group bacterium]
MIPVWKKNYQRYKAYFSHIVAQYKNSESFASYFEITLSLITICIFAIFALKPTLYTIAELIKQIDQNTQTIKMMNQKIQDITKAQILYDKERSKITIFNQLIPNGAHPEIIIRQIENLSSKNNIPVKVNMGQASILGKMINQPNKTDLININHENKERNLSYIEVTLTASTPTTNYQQLYNFLSDLEKQRLPIIIKQFDLTITKTKDNNNLLLFIKMQVPYLPFYVE